MKRTFIIILLATICGLMSMAQDRPDITHQSTGGDRDGFISLSAGPTLKYNFQYQAITVTGTGLSEYYIAEIRDVNSNETVYCGMLDGEIDVIDASMLMSGAPYIITLKDEYGWIFTYTFENGIITYNGAHCTSTGKSVLPSTTKWDVLF